MNKVKRGLILAVMSLVVILGINGVSSVGVGESNNDVAYTVSKVEQTRIQIDTNEKEDVENAESCEREQLVIASGNNPKNIIDDDEIVLHSDLIDDEETEVAQPIQQAEESDDIEEPYEYEEEYEPYDEEEYEELVENEYEEEYYQEETYYTDDDLYVLAHVICGEAQGCSWDMQAAVGSVVLNRVNHYAFPNTITDVVFQSGQYACTWDGNYYREPTETNWEVAEYLLENGSVLPSYVVYQANGAIGDTVYTTIDGMVFSYNSYD